MRFKSRLRSDRVEALASVCGALDKLGDRAIVFLSEDKMCLALAQSGKKYGSAGGDGSFGAFAELSTQHLFSDASGALDYRIESQRCADPPPHPTPPPRNTHPAPAATTASSSRSAWPTWCARSGPSRRRRRWR